MGIWKRIVGLKIDQSTFIMFGFHPTWLVLSNSIEANSIGSKIVFIFVELSETTIWVEDFGESFFSIFWKTSDSTYSAMNKSSKPLLYFPASFLLVRLITTNPCGLNWSLVISWLSWSLKIWSIFFGLEETGKNCLCFLWLFVVEV